MISMTGYGYAESTDDARLVAVEIRSYNNRYLEIAQNLPANLSALEPEVRSRVAGHVRRGKVDIQVRVREFSSAFEVHLDEGAARDAIALLGRLSREEGVSGGVTVGDVLRVDGVLTSERRRSEALLRDAILAMVDEACRRLHHSRTEEGRATREDIVANFDRIRSFQSLFAEMSDRTEAHVLQVIRDRFRAVLGDEADEQRIYAEAAVLMVKHSTNEEMKRLTSHLDLFKATISQPGPVGKKLDFICQEINREINTMASKALFPEVQRGVVEAKDALESIREQVRNIE